MRIEPEISGVSIVLVGKFNPAIFTPAWFTLHDLLPKSTEEDAQLQVAHQRLTVFSIDWLRSGERPSGRASVFKVPHHGSANAHEDGVWRHMLDPGPFAVLTPWRRGGRVLPSRQDVQRILTYTGHAFTAANAKQANRSRKRQDRLVTRALREAKARLREQPILAGTVRLRRHMNPGSEWKVEVFGPACHLSDFAA